MPKTPPKQQGIDPEDIKSELRKLKITMRAIAASLDCSENSVRLVIHNQQQSKRIATHVANLIGKPIDEIWPNQYNYEQRPSYKQRRREQVAA